MPKQAYKPAALRESWRPDSANAEQLANRQRNVKRLLTTALLALFVSAFCYLLFAPLFHPTLRLYFLTAGSYDAMDIKPIPYFQEDAVRFLSIDGSFRKEDATNEFSFMNTPEEARKYLERIVNSASQKSDVALIQISAHPMLEGDRPFLKCSNFVREKPENGSISIEELLNLLDRMAVGTTVVCLELGPSDSQCFGDSIRDDFLYRLRDLLKSRKTPNLWMLVSNSPQEGSYASMELRSSVFSYAVTKGLQGAADLNNDTAIDLDEFTRYVVGFTQSQVQRESGGNTQQTPILFSTGANSNTPLNSKSIASTPNRRAPFSWASFVPNLWGSDASKDDATEQTTDQDAEKVQAEKSWLTEYLAKSANSVRERTLDELADNIKFLPYSIGNRIKKTVGIIDDESAESTYSTPKSETAATETIVGGNATIEDAGTARKEQQAALEPMERLRKPMPDMSRLADPKQSHLQLLQLAWLYCEYLELPQVGTMRPMDLAPHAWNEFTSHLHGIEERLRTDSAMDTKILRLEITSEIVGAYELAMTGRSQVGKLAKRVSGQMPDLGLPKATFPSIGLMESFAEFGGPPLPNALSVQIQQLDTAISNDTSELFDKWYAQLPKDLSVQYLEFFWPQQLVSKPSTPWRITRRVIGLWRQYEQLSYDPLNSNVFVQQKLTYAQLFLLEGTRLALDQIGTDWVDRCLLTLGKAEQALTESSVKRNQLRDAMQLRNQTLAELPSILRWRKIAATQLGISHLDEDLEKALNSLAKLCELLRNRERCELGDVVRTHASLKASLQRMQNYWIEESNGLIAENSKPSITSNWITDSLLATPLIRGQLRNRLLVLPLYSTTPVDSEIDQDSKLPNLSPSRILNKNIETQLRFELMAARIAGMNLDTSSIETFQIAGAIDSFYGKLADQISNAFDKLGTWTTDKDLKLPLEALRMADQSLRLLPPLDSHLFDGKPLESKLWQQEFLQCLQQKLIVTQKCFQDALPEEVPFLNNAIERLAFCASALAGTQQNVTRQPSRLKIRGTSSISLMAEPQSAGEVFLQNVGKPINNAWVLVDYDPSILELQGPSGVLLNQVSMLPHKVDNSRRQAEQQLMQAIAAGSESLDERKIVEEARKRVNTLTAELTYPISPETSMVAPTMGLAAGQVVTIPFKIRRVGIGPSQSKLVWKLVGDNEYVRHEVMIQLPEAEKLRLQVDGIANSWAPTHEGIALYLWPNRLTEYRIGLRNDSGKPRVLGVDMVALMSRRDVTLPEGFLTPSASQEIADLLGQTKLIATIPEVALDSKSDAIWLPLQPLDRVDETPVVPAKETPAVPIPTDQGLVLVLTDKMTNQKYWRRVETRVRHPRSYIEPTIRFDAVSERAEIRLKARQPDTVPVQGIDVVGRILEPLPRGTEMKLEGTVLAGEVAVLYCQVPTVGAREVTFEIDVDGFPRAFVIKVPCWRTNPDISVVSDFQKIEFIEPTDGLNIGPNDQSQRVRLKIDAIPGAFETKRDYVEVGWDLDRDREFADETTFRFAADRQVDVVVNSILNGRMSMTANVGDIAFDLPPPSLKNQRVNLLARLFAGGEMVWSKPIEIVADSDPPTITGIEVTPGTTFPQGIDLMVRVGVDDAKLSGIASVELVIDTNGVGKFTDSAEAPKSCARQSDGAWTLSLPTADLKPGRATLFVRTTDRVGNKSVDSKTVLSILSEQDWQEKLKSLTQELTGTVLYSDNPLPEAKVTLEDEKGVVVQRTNTDERGAFRFLGVQAGKYKVVAIGVMKNRPRKAEQNIEVGVSPAPPIRLRLQAK